MGNHYGNVQIQKLFSSIVCFHYIMTVTVREQMTVSDLYAYSLLVTKDDKLGQGSLFTYTVLRTS